MWSNYSKLLVKKKLDFQKINEYSLKNTRKNNDHPKLARTRWMHFEQVRVITSILNWYSLKNVLSIDFKDDICHSIKIYYVVYLWEILDSKWQTFHNSFFN